MSMKKFVTSIALLGIASSFNLAHAETLKDYKLYAGLEYKYQLLKSKRDWSKILPKNFNNVGVLLGAKFNEETGVEFGYSKSTRKNKNNAFTAGDTLFGAAPGAGSTTTAKVRLSSFHVDVLGFMPLHGDDFSWIGTIGVASVKPKINITDNFAASTNVINGKNKLIPRIGIGAQYQENAFAVRGVLRWEQTSRLRASLGTFKNTFPQASNKIYKSGISFAVSGILSL